jgi:hypothetical protein
MNAPATTRMGTTPTARRAKIDGMRQEHNDDSAA